MCCKCGSEHVSRSGSRHVILRRCWLPASESVAAELGLSYTVMLARPTSELRCTHGSSSGQLFLPKAV